MVPAVVIMGHWLVLGPGVRRKYAGSTPEIHPRPALPFNTPQVCLHVLTPHEYPWKPQYIYVNFVAAQWANGLFCYPDYTGSTPGVRREYAGKYAPGWLWR